MLAIRRCASDAREFLLLKEKQNWVWETPSVDGRRHEVWGLVSDVHGNLPALQRALDMLRAAGATKFAFLGDYLGRGDSDGCIQLIKHVADVAIVGNRDLDWQHRVSAESAAFVLELPRTARCGELLLSHGDARLTPALSTAQIGRGFVKVWPELEHHRAQVWGFGHSHHARVWRKQRDRDAAELLTASTIPIEDGDRYCLNVGTTGLPFPGKGGPSVATVDFTKREIRQIALESG
jgi:predicted phosphodiesterase